MRNLAKCTMEQTSRMPFGAFIPHSILQDPFGDTILKKFSAGDFCRLLVVLKVKPDCQLCAQQL